MVMLPQGFELEQAVQPAQGGLTLPEGFEIEQDVPRETSPRAKVQQQIFQELIQLGVPQDFAQRESLRLAVESGFRTGQTITGLPEVAATLATGAIAEPVSGIAGLVSAPFVGADKAADIVRGTQEALTFQPRTEAGKTSLEAVGGLLQPVGEVIQAAEETLGDFGNRQFGPVGGAIGATIPTAILLALGIKKKAGGAPDITPQRAREIEVAIAAGQREGIDVLTSDIFQPKSIFSRLSQQFSERIPIFGVGGKRGAQQTKRIEALDRLDESIPRVEAADIVENLNQSANKVRVAAGKRIETVTESMDQLGIVATPNAIKAIDASVEKLSRPGKLPNQAVVEELQSLKQTLSEADQGFASLREFRTDARAIADKVDPQGRSQLRSSDKVLLDNVIAGVTKDLDGFVLGNTNSANLARYKKADQIYAQEATKLTKSRLKTILDKGDINPELVNNLLFSSSPSQVRLLFKSLDAKGRQNARMSLFRRALDNSTKKGVISPERFVTELNKLGNNFQTFFKGDARAELNGLKRLLETTGRAGEAGVVGPTGQALQLPATTALLAGAAIGDPRAIATLLLASTAGLTARAYESAGVRNMLIRLGKAPKRSTLAVDLRNSIPLLVAEANRAIEQEEQSTETPSETSQVGQ